MKEEFVILTRSISFVILVPSISIILLPLPKITPEELRVEPPFRANTSSSPLPLILSLSPFVAFKLTVVLSDEPPFA